MMKLEHIEDFDKTIYKDAGTTAVKECHFYVDCVDKNLDASKNKQNIIINTAEHR